MSNVLARAEAVLRGDRAVVLSGRAGLTVLHLVGFTFAGGLFYGMVMGSFGGIAGERAWQMVYAAVKVPLLLLATFLISLPSFFVLNTLLGVRADFPEVLRAVTAGQAGLAIVLAALAPYTALWYASFPGYNGAILFNGVMFAVASWTAQQLLRGAYAPLIARHPSHRYLLPTWFFLYSFVAMQMAWVLRPFVGSPAMAVQFFREESWGNAYVFVGRTIWQVLSR